MRMTANLRLLTAATAIGLALAGCAPRAGDGPTDSGRPGGEPAKSAPAVTEIQIDKSYWHTGFKVTLGAARIVASSSGNGQTVTIEGMFQNLSSEIARAPIPDVLLTVGNRTYAEIDRSLTELPEVPAQRSQPGVYAFAVDERFVLADAALLVGKPSSRQATIPFSGADGLVALEPKPVPVTGKVLRGKSGDIFMTVSAVEVRSDEPYLHGQAPTGQEYIRLTFSATNNTDAGFAWVFDRDLNLKMPDGSSMGAADNCSRAQIYPAPHSTAVGGLACFLVPAPASGEYLLSWDRYAEGALRVPIH
jgi:hypothetical protein